MPSSALRSNDSGTLDSCQPGIPGTGAVVPSGHDVGEKL